MIFWSLLRVFQGIPRGSPGGSKIYPGSFHGVQIHTVFDADAESANGLGGFSTKSLYFGSEDSPGGGGHRDGDHGPKQTVWLVAIGVW
jgi:hypothetical protein